MKNRFHLSLALVALAYLAGWTVNAQRSSPVGQAWEYKSMVLTRSIVEPDFTWAEDGKPLPGTPNMILKAKELGAQGWELVSITPMASQTGNGLTGFTNHLFYWFKRPK